jgi:hypothetical protein
MKSLLFIFVAAILYRFGQASAVGSYIDAYMSGGFIPLSSIQTLVYDTERHDLFNSYDSSTGIYTCPEDGIYQIKASLSLFNPTSSTRDGSQRNIGLVINGGTLDPRNDVSIVDVQGDPTPVNFGVSLQITITTAVSLAAGDTVILVFGTDSTGPPSVNAFLPAGNVLRIVKI